MKKIEVFVSVSWETDKDFVYQTFNYDDKNYITNPSYIIHQKFEEKIIDNSLKNNMDISFNDMVRNDGSIVIKYKISKNFNKNSLKPYFYKLFSNIPDYDGCYFCRFYNKKNNTNICSFQDNKIINYPKKNCRFFKQKKINQT
jgi:hypothetical protein